ncbi:hypothetical protein GCM10023322_69200 [Rugosimonospora acidiphila]|uniref:Methyltransferase domain-containing protein n=1 Tax=Rugosimonospora acidiphila TaxID=556531 RepID=A0ABP9SKL0_9ACTN
MIEVADKVYRNRGNTAVLDLVDRDAVTVLDVGCGAGDNAASLQRRDPHKRIFGITGSPKECALAGEHMELCWVADLEAELPPEIDKIQFDCLVFSHVLEHLRDPAALVARLVPSLAPGGTCVIAVPNVLNWRDRLDFLRGRFEYRDIGTLDATHLRFYTYRTAARQLLATAPELAVELVTVSGDVPLWRLMRRLLPERTCVGIRELGRRRWPNLFGWQVLIKARRVEAAGNP